MGRSMEEEEGAGLRLVDGGGEDILGRQQQRQETS